MKIYLLVLVMFLSACAKKEVGPKKTEVAKPEVLSVRVQSAAEKILDRSIDITGTLEADEMVNLSSEVAGRIATFSVDFGQAVRKGDVIAQLDKREFEWQLERSKATLDQTAARLGMKSASDRFPTTTATIRQAEAQLEDARSKYNSAAKLVQSGDISKERANELEKGLQARQAVVDAARDELNVLIAQLRAQKTDVELASKRLNDSVIRAPFDGGISAKLVSPGQFIKENTPVATLVKTSPLRLRIEVPESSSALIRPGSTVTYSTDAAPGKEFSATIQKLNPSFESKNRTLTAEARVTVQDSRLRPGSFVQVRLVTQKSEPVVMVPKEAVYSVAGLTKVFVIRDGKAVELKIAPGVEQNGWSEMPAGTVQAGEKVAVSNLVALVNGAAVKVI
jgi:RND family efflux transporter MFP subunit